MRVRPLSARWLVVWSVVGGATAWRFRPPVTPTRPRDPAPNEPDVPRRSRRLDRLGEAVIGRVPALRPLPPRHVASALCAGAVTSPLLGVWSLVLVAVLFGGARIVARRAAGRRLDRALSEVAVISDLLGIAIAGGLGLGGALLAVNERLRPGSDSGLGEVVVDLERGRSLDDAMSTWSRRGEPIDELVALIRAADRAGAAIGDGLGRLGADLRRRRRRRAEERARRLPVTMLPPLVLCILPAFGLVTVVPMVVVGLGRLGSMT